MIRLLKISECLSPCYIANILTTATYTCRFNAAWNIWWFMEAQSSDRINLPLFSTVLPSNSRLFLSCRSFVVITTFSTGLVGVEVTSVSWLGQLTVGDLNCPSQETEVTSRPARPVENVITTKGLQDRNNLLLDGRTVENKGKLILTEIFPSGKNMIFKSIDSHHSLEADTNHMNLVLSFSEPTWWTLNCIAYCYKVYCLLAGPWSYGR